MRLFYYCWLALLPALGSAQLPTDDYTLVGMYNNQDYVSKADLIVVLSRDDLPAAGVPDTTAGLIFLGPAGDTVARTPIGRFALPARARDTFVYPLPRLPSAPGRDVVFIGSVRLADRPGELPYRKELMLDPSPPGNLDPALICAGTRYAGPYAQQLPSGERTWSVRYTFDAGTPQWASIYRSYFLQSTAGDTLTPPSSPSYDFPRDHQDTLFWTAPLGQAPYWPERDDLVFTITTPDCSKPLAPRPVVTVEPDPAVGVRVYPNPSRGVVTLVSPVAGRYAVYDQLGRRHRTGQLTAGGQQLGLADLPPGLYYLTVTAANDEWVSCLLLH